MNATREELARRFFAVRKQTEALCQPLCIEDYVVQPMVDVSPPKWHLGHTSWFFEKFLLEKFSASYALPQPIYNFIFNSYYNSVGVRVERHQRGALSRPTVEEVYQYRHDITARLGELIESIDESAWKDFHELMLLGIHHEQQHQELLVTDIKHILAMNPLRPAYHAAALPTRANTLPETFIDIAAGVYCIGYNGNGFCFDNEQPAHKVYVDAFALQNRLVTNGEWLEFIEDGGYNEFRHWLSDGWDAVQREQWRAPLYWENLDGVWHEMTLSGLRPIDRYAPVCHISYYEAEAFASWKGKRLPSEAEWEIACSLLGAKTSGGNFLESGYLHPVAVSENDLTTTQLFGDVWEWTGSAYLPYPNYKHSSGALGEYNGKFMSNQMTLRGGSCATPESHIRATYRNFFQPDKRWQFTGMRLATSR